MEAAPPHPTVQDKPLVSPMTLFLSYVTTHLLADSLSSIFNMIRMFMQEMNTSQDVPLWSKSPSSITGIMEIVSQWEPLVFHSPLPHPHSLRLSQRNKQSDSVIGGLGAFSPLLKRDDGCPCESVWKAKTSLNCVILTSSLNPWSLYLY